MRVDHISKDPAKHADSGPNGIDRLVGSNRHRGKVVDMDRLQSIAFVAVYAELAHVPSALRVKTRLAHGLALEPLGDLRLERCEALSAGFPRLSASRG